MLAAWCGGSNAAIARELDINEDTVRKWRHRFVRDGMPVTAGSVYPKIIVNNNSGTFIGFLTDLGATVDPAKKIHLILDNASSHTSKQTELWLAEHPRFTVTYTPTHASYA